MGKEPGKKGKRASRVPRETVPKKPKKKATVAKPVAEKKKKSVQRALRSNRVAATKKIIEKPPVVQPALALKVNTERQMNLNEDLNIAIQVMLNDLFSINKRITRSSQHRFTALTKIVTHMRSKFQKGDDDPLTFEEIMEETHQVHIPKAVKQWLVNEALIKNPNLEVIRKDGTVKYSFNHPLLLKN